MSRVEKFRERRILKRKYISLLLLSFIIVSVGVIQVDYSLNDLMNNNKGIQLVTVVSVGSNENPAVKISFFEKSMVINTKFIERDYIRIKNALKELF